MSHQTVDVLGEVIVTSYDPHGDVFAVPCRGNGSNEEREADEKVSLLKQRPQSLTRCRPSDRVGKFKPRRQANKPPDLSFLTGDATSAEPSAGPSEDGSAPPTPIKK